MARILIVEDEPRIASFVAKGLRADGHVATVVVRCPSERSPLATNDAIRSSSSTIRMRATGPPPAG